MNKLIFTENMFYFKKYGGLIFHKETFQEVTGIQLSSSIPYTNVVSGIYLPYEITFEEKFQLKGERIRRFDFVTEKFRDEFIVGDSVNVCLDDMNSFALFHREGSKKTIYYYKGEVLWEEESGYDTLSEFGMLWTDTAIIKQPRTPEPYQLKCIHPATKDQLWELDLSSYGKSYPTFHKDSIGKRIDYLNYYQDTILATIGRTGLAINRYTGEILWSKDKFGRILLIHGQSVFFLWGFLLIEIDILTGELVREGDLNRLKEYGMKQLGASWHIHDNKIFVKDSYNLIIAILDYKTLEPLDIYKEKDIQLEDGNYIERFDGFEVHDNKIFMTATTYKAKQMTCIYEY